MAPLHLKKELLKMTQENLQEERSAPSAASPCSVLLTARWAEETSRLNLCYPSASLSAALTRLECK